MAVLQILCSFPLGGWRQREKETADKPTMAAFAYWREHLGDVPLDKITDQQIALHRDPLLGAACRGHNHKTSKPRSSATVRNYVIELSRLFTLAVKELRVMESNPCAK